MYTQAELWALKLNQKLLTMYKALGPMSVSQATKKLLSVPLLSMVGPGYTPGESLLVVGQETYGWGGNPKTIGSSLESFEVFNRAPSAEAIAMEAQADFILDRWGHVKAKTKNSPFWRAVIKVSGVKSMADLLTAGVTWSDLLLCDHNGKTPLRKGVMNRNDLTALLDQSNKAFKGLLKHTQPKVSLLFTGPSYDWILEDWFNLPKNWKDSDLRSLPECSDPNEPLLQYVKIFRWNGTLFIRTYHPAYLYRNKKKGYLKILDILAATLKNMGVIKP